jgi:hypothetical protein
VSRLIHGGVRRVSSTSRNPSGIVRPTIAAGRLRTIGFWIALLGAAYAVCALVPRLFIREKMFDPNGVALER